MAKVRWLPVLTQGARSLSYYKDTTQPNNPEHKAHMFSKH